MFSRTSVFGARKRRLCVDRRLKRRKNIRFQKYPDTCGRGLSQPMMMMMMMINMRQDAIKCEDLLPPEDSCVFSFNEKLIWKLISQRTLAARKGHPNVKATLTNIDRGSLLCGRIDDCHDLLFLIVSRIGGRMHIYMPAGFEASKLNFVNMRLARKGKPILFYYLYNNPIHPKHNVLNNHLSILYSCR